VIKWGYGPITLTKDSIMPDTQQQQGGIRDWMRKVEADLERLDDKWQKSTDDIKLTIKGEISSLKSEQLADFKRRLEEGYHDLKEFETRIQKIEMEQLRWQTSAGLVNWLIKFAFAVIGAAATIIGYETFKHY
jgi:septal ring factor EnvC (AmiA/AmiB activator)